MIRKRLAHCYTKWQRNTEKWKHFTSLRKITKTMIEEVNIPRCWVSYSSQYIFDDQRRSNHRLLQ